MNEKQWFKIAYLQLHRICDQDCIFCAQPSNGKFLNFWQVQELLDDLIQKKYYWVIFSWGEPSISPYLMEAISYASKHNLFVSILTNWQGFQKIEVVQEAIQRGLKKFHISLHSHIPEIHDSVVKKEGSFIRSMIAMRNVAQAGWNLYVNMTMHKYNITYFDKSIKFLLTMFPNIKGFIINNLELSQIKKENYHIIASLDSIKSIIIPVLDIIQAAKKFVRVERVPLCFLRWYEHLSVDLEYTLMNDSKLLHYLEDERVSWELNASTFAADYTYWKSCAHCDLRTLCWGIYGLGMVYHESELIPQKYSKSEMNQVIKNTWEYLS